MDLLKNTNLLGKVAWLTSNNVFRNFVDIKSSDKTSVWQPTEGEKGWQLRDERKTAWNFMTHADWKESLHFNHAFDIWETNPISTPNSEHKENYKRRWGREARRDLMNKLGKFSFEWTKYHDLQYIESKKRLELLLYFAILYHKLENKNNWWENHWMKEP